MMKKAIVMILAVVAWLSASAVPAKPGVYTFTQSDGSTIHVSRVGDEWHSSYVTDDGLTVSRDAKGDFYYLDKNGITAVKAHDSNARGIDESGYVSQHASELRLGALIDEPTLNKRKGLNINSRLKANQSIKPSGTQYVPVVLVSYSDIKFKDADPVATFTSFFNSGSSSVEQYFHDQSNGQFAPKFEILGHVGLTNPRAYYGAHSSRWGNDARVGTMVAEGCLGITGVDWTKYDNDNDGYIDAVIVIYAGVGEASSNVDDAVWPCRWQIYGSDYGYKYAYVNAGSGTKKVNAFGVFNELSGYDNSKIDGIGTVCHEFSHVLGLPDYYDTNYAGHFGMGDWSLMDGGCYNNNGYTPCAYGAYEKSFMGWRDLEDAVPGTTYNLTATTSATGVGIKVPTDNSSEYYILENIQKTGWNAYAPNSGLLVTHVYYNSSAWSNNTVNNYDTRRMTIIPADNSLKMVLSDSYYFADTDDQVNDTYPYGNNNSLTDTSSPSADIYTGSGKMGKPITSITKNSNGTVSFVYIASAAFGGDAPVLNIDESSIVQDGFTATWNACSGASGYTVRLTPFNSVLNETFGKCTTASETAINGSLDAYTDIPGWTGYRARPQEGGFRLGNSGSTGTLGSITYSALDLSNSGGKVALQFTAFGYDGDDTPLNITCGGQTQTVTLTSSSASYTVVFDEVTAEASQKLVFQNGTKGKRVTVSSINVATPDATGEQQYPATGTSLTLTDLEWDSYYMVDMKATYSGGDSDWSNSILVHTKDGEFIAGDVNLDGMVNVFDVVSTGLYIVETQTGRFYFKAGDVNEDGVVNVADLVGIVNLSLGLNVYSPIAGLNSLSGSELSLGIAPFSLTAGESRDIDIVLTGAEAYTAMQLDLQLPPGISVTSSRVAPLGAEHDVSASVVSTGDTRVLVYNAENVNFAASQGALITLTLTANEQFAGEGELTVDNIVVSDRAMNAVTLSPVKVKIGKRHVTAIDNVAVTEVKLYANGDRVVVDTPVSEQMTIANIGGMTQTVMLRPGRNIVSLSGTGLYIIKVADKTVKILH